MLGLNGKNQPRRLSLASRHGNERGRRRRRLGVERLQQRVMFYSAAVELLTFGPLPYRSAADTPADFRCELCDDCEAVIENFEDNALDPRIQINTGNIIAPNFGTGIPRLADSVDADDGTIDGTGQTGAGGRSWRSLGNSLTITFPQIVNSAGLVWTDGSIDVTNVRFEAFDQSMNLIWSVDAGDIADDSNQGTTAEDRFFGLRYGDGNLTGIRVLQVTNFAAGIGIEIDHIQFEDCGDCVTGQPWIDLELTKRVSTTAPQVGQTVTWTLELRNAAGTATVPATGVNVRDILPPQVSLVEAVLPPGDTYDPVTGIWAVSGALPVGATRTLQLRTTINPGLEGILIGNRAEVVSANETDFDSQPNNDDGDQSEDDEDRAVIQVVGLASVSGYSYVDVNNDGIFQATETPLLGVQITLTGTQNGQSFTRTTFTNANGFYRFTDLPAGTYTLVQTQPTQFVDGRETVGSLGGDASVNDRIVVSLSAGQQGENYNFGERGLISPNKRLFLTSTVLDYYLPIDVRQGDIWYKVAPGTGNFLQLQTVVNPALGGLDSELFDASMTGVIPLPGSGAKVWELNSQATYYLRLSGTNTSASVRLLASSSGIKLQQGNLVVAGTSGDDVVRVQVGATTAKVSLGDQTREFLLSDLRSVDVQLGSGNDQLMITGSDVAEQLKISSLWLQYTHPRFTLNANGAERQSVALGGGIDSVQWYGSSATDQLMVMPGRAQSTNNGRVTAVTGFEQFDAWASENGADQVILYDLPGADRIAAGLQQTSITGEGYRATAVGFKRVLVQSQAGALDVIEVTGNWVQESPYRAVLSRPDGGQVILESVDKSVLQLSSPPLVDSAAGQGSEVVKPSSGALGAGLVDRVFRRTRSLGVVT